jgi:hypothetical protein
MLVYQRVFQIIPVDHTTDIVTSFFKELRPMQGDHSNLQMVC